MSRGRLLLLLLLLGALGCDDGVTPALSAFTFDGPAEDSPLVLLLSVDFHDGDGDLGAEGAVLETFIDQRPTSAGPLPLTDIFLDSDVPLAATDGTLRFVLELAFSDDAPGAGSSFTLGVRATDAALHTSSTHEIKLKIN